jgi:hypothetical protein
MDACMVHLDVPKACGESAQACQVWLKISISDLHDSTSCDGSHPHNWVQILPILNKGSTQEHFYGTG